MGKVAYQDKRLQGPKLARVMACAEIAEEYLSKGYVLTVRQLYYQLVARGKVENTMKSYQNVVMAVLDGRLNGLIDWDAVEDRTRELVVRSRWTSPSEIVQSCAKQYHEDMWSTQERRVFVVVEKEALAGVLDPICHRWDVPLLAARGYASASVVREFALTQLQRWWRKSDQASVVLYLGDHDPSGIDMPNDLGGRLRLFAGSEVEIEVRRIALNMDQVEEVKPPENPAKKTDSRFDAYEAEFGDKSWELDALTPEYLEELVERHIKGELDMKAWKARAKDVEAGKLRLEDTAARLEDD